MKLSDPSTFRWSRIVKDFTHESQNMSPKLDQNSRNLGILICIPSYVSQSGATNTIILVTAILVPFPTPQVRQQTVWNGTSRNDWGSGGRALNRETSRNNCHCGFALVIEPVIISRSTLFRGHSESCHFLHAVGPPFPLFSLPLLIYPSSRPLSFLATRL